MRRIFLIFSSFVILIGVLFIIFISTVGVKTNKFNHLVENKIKELDQRLLLELNDIYLKFDFKERSLNLVANNPKISIEKDHIDIRRMETDLNIINFFKKENLIKKIIIQSNNNKIENLVKFLNTFEFNLPRALILSQIKSGFIETDVELYSNNNFKNFEFEISGKLSDVELDLLFGESVKKLNFFFKIKDNNYKFSNLNFNIDNIDFSSNNLVIKRIINEYEVNGELNSSKAKIDLKKINKIVNNNVNFLDNKAVEAETKNIFSFKVNSNKKIENLKVESNINFDKIYFNPELQNLIYLKNGNIIYNNSNKNISIEIASKYNFIKEENNNNQDDAGFVNLNIFKEPEKNYKIKSFIKSNKNNLNSDEILKIINISDDYIKNQNLIFDSENNIEFEIDNKNQFKNLNLISKINLESIEFNYNSELIKNIFTEYGDKVTLKNNIIEVNFSDTNKKLNFNGNYSIKDGFDKFNIYLDKSKEKLKFSSKIEFNNTSIKLDQLKYIKNKDTNSNLVIEGTYMNNKDLNFNKIFFNENKNTFLINDILISKNLKIVDLQNLKLNYKNYDNNFNELTFSKNKNDYNLFAKKFDGKSFIKDLISGNSKKTLLDYFSNFNSKILIDISEFLVSDSDILNNLNGSLNIQKNKTIAGNLSAKLNKKNEFSLNIKTNSRNQKITNLFINEPEPFIKNYKFLKGFSEGSLSYESIETDNKSNSKLKIYDFKVKEVPILAKLLSLASLQGIADLLTGEGIRFSEFDMEYEKSNNLTTVKEMYAIGPAISILMDGYIEKDKLTSLRGTLVPATTINKTISKIPLLGDILVGKKVGEGVFGVSFKIKGPPNNLETTVNPIKTLTPRFITRTLEKIKTN